MLFVLPDILRAERAGRTLAAGILRAHADTRPSIQVAASTSLAGAAALAAARHLANAHLETHLVLTDSDLGAHDAFAVMLEVAGCMDLPLRQSTHLPEQAGTVLLDGTDTGGGGSTHNARSALSTEPQDDPAPWLQPADAAPAQDAETTRAIDRKAIEDFGLPGLCLMENAALGAVGVVMEMLAENPASEACPVTLLAGPGNNGGDALAITRELLSRGIPARAWLLGERGKLKGDARENAGLLSQAPDALVPMPESADALRDCFAASSLLIDGLFGTGLDRAVEGPARSVIESANASGTPILALDIPSGLHADSGEILGVCVRAQRTVSFAAAKRGFFRSAGPEQSGTVTVAGIGCPQELIPS